MKSLFKTLTITSLFAISSFSAANTNTLEINPKCYGPPSNMGSTREERHQWYQVNCAESLPNGPIRSRDPQKATTNDDIIFPKD